MRKVNYRSDFDFVLRLLDCRGDEVGFPEYDWVARFWTGVKANAYEVSFVGGVCRGCYNDGGRIHVVVDNHHLSPGVLKVEFVAMLPEGIYPDGDERVAVPAVLDVELVREAAPCPSSFEVEVMLPYIKFRYEDLTDEQKAELMRPAVVAAERAEEVMRVAEAAESERAEREDLRTVAENARVSAEASRVEAEEARKAAEQGRVAAEKGRVTAEEARVAAERERAEVFDGFRGELDGKADKPAVFEVEVTKTISSDWTGAFYECSVSPFPGETVRQGDVLHILLPSDGNSSEGYRRVVICKTYYKRGIGRYGGFTTSPDEPAFVFLDVAMSSATLEVRTLASAGNVVELQNTVQSMGYEMEDKADRTELSNILGSDTEGSIEAIEPGIVTEALRKVPQTLTPEEQTVVKNNIGVSKMELFCDLFSNAAGSYGYARLIDGEFDCELNGLKLTYDEAVAIYHQGTFDSRNSSGKNFTQRTNLPITASWASGTIAESFNSDSFVMDVEVALLASKHSSSTRFSAYPISIYSKPFWPRLVKIIGEIDFHFARATINWFVNAVNLEEVQITRLAWSINLSSCSRLSLESFQYMIKEAYTDPGSNHDRVITVHPDVYAKLTDESNTEWHKVLTDASAKNISFATV